MLIFIVFLAHGARAQAVVLRMLSPTGVPVLTPGSCGADSPTDKRGNSPDCNSGNASRDTNIFEREFEHPVPIYF